VQLTTVRPCDIDCCQDLILFAECWISPRRNKLATDGVEDLES